MKARIDPTLTLEDVVKHIEQWRRSKKKGESGYRSSYGAKHSAWWVLMGSRGSAESCVSAIQNSTSAAGSSRQVGTGGVPGEEGAFVEIEPVLVDQILSPDATALWMELERPDGLGLRIRPTSPEA